jgi:hypothetical protein
MPVQQRRRCEEATLQSNSKLGSFNAAVVAVSGALIVIYIERQFSADANGIPAHVEPEAVPLVI